MNWKCLIGWHDNHTKEIHWPEGNKKDTLELMQVGTVITYGSGALLLWFILGVCGVATWANVLLPPLIFPPMLWFGFCRPTKDYYCVRCGRMRYNLTMKNLSDECRKKRIKQLDKLYYETKREINNELEV